MKGIKLAILATVMLIMVAFGGLVTTDVCADDETESADVIAVESVEDVEEPIVEEPTAEYVEDENENNDECYNKYCEEPTTPTEIIEEQTGLVVDYIKTIDSCDGWGAYYVHSDGDLYVITIDDGYVDVCVILN